MARSLNKKYFGNRNIGSTSTTADDGIGGKGVASVTISGVWSGYTQATSTVTFSAPELPGGVTATGTVTITAGAPTLVTITNKGSGYIAAPTVTIADSDVGAETAGTATAVLEVDSGSIRSETNNENAIVMYANLGNGAGKVDIIRQVSARRYKVTDGTSTGIVTLGTDGTPETGEAYIVATATGGTYYVTKLTGRRATLVAKTGDEALDGLSAPWSFDAGTATVVQIENA